MFAVIASSMNWKRILYWLMVPVALLVLAVGLLSAFVYYYQDEIEQRLLSELNKNLQTEVEVYGDIDLSVLARFPDISLKANDILIKGSTGMEGDTLIRAGELYLITNIWDLWQQNWRIQEIEINDGVLNMVREKSGRINYQFVKPSEETDTTSVADFLLNIESATLANIQFYLLDEPAGTRLDFLIDEAVFSGNFSPDALNLEVDINLLSNILEIKEINYAREKDMQLSGTLHIDTENNRYEINTEEAYIAGNRFLVNGSFSLPDDKSLFDIEIKGINLSLGGFLALFPEDIAASFDDYNASGNLQFEVGIHGELSAKNNPEITLSYEVTDTRLHYTFLAEDIERLDLKGTYTNGKKRNLSTSEVNITFLKAIHQGDVFEATAKVTNLNDPKLEITANGFIHLPMLQPLLPDTGSITGLLGWVELTDLSYKGTAKEFFPDHSPKTIDLKGDIRLDNAGVVMGADSLYFKKGAVSVSPWTIMLNELNLHYAGNDLALNGKLTDWKGYLYNLMTDKRQQVKPLGVDLTVTGNSLVYKESTTGSISPGKEQAEPATVADYLNVQGRLDLKLNEVVYNKLVLNDVVLNTRMDNGTLTIDKLESNLLGGNLKSNGSLYTNQNIARLELIGNTKNINISKLFEGMDDFGQTELTHQNIAGTLHATFSIKASFINGELDEQSLYMLSDITLEDGELKNVQSLESLSAFVKLEELRHIKFENLKNQIEIKGRTINFPGIVIKSSAMNMYLSGTHTFDNYIDYRIKLNVYDVLANKLRKKKNEQFYEVVDENSFNFFISMKGPLDNPEIKYDKKGVKERFKMQKNELSNAIQGIYEEYNRDKEQRDWELPPEDEFLDWD